MSDDRTLLVERTRAALADAGHPAARETHMFGCRAFMIDDKLAIGVRGNSDLLVRIDPERYDELLRVSDAKPAEMGAGRTMGPGWLDVTADALDDDALDFWIGVALEYNPRAVRSGSKKRRTTPLA